MKLCIVIQRYGADIIGGAEAYTRIYAEKLARRHHVEVLTTCAFDYSEWRNHYPEGDEQISGVLVHRFKVDKTRDSKTFDELTRRVYGNPHHTREQGERWVREMGPVSEGLIRYIAAHKDDFDLFLFMTYMYYPTAIGLGVVPERAVLVPFAHDEPAIYVKGYDTLFTSPRGIIYNTTEEREIVQRIFDNTDIPNILTGIGLDIPPESTWPDARKRYGLKGPYMVYMGRIDSAKGCDKLFEYFRTYKEERGGDLKLVLMGSEVIKIPKSKDIIYLGFASEEEKYAVLRDCELLVLPSSFESLSIVVLEAFALRKPVLVSGHCAVLKGHCQKSNAGLYFYGEPDFVECLDLLVKNPDLRAAMGALGARYVDAYYRWDIILEKMDAFFEELASKKTQEEQQDQLDE